MSLDFLDTLESRVRDAAAAIEALRERNAELEARLAELEAAASDAGAEDWPAERAELERRVAQLVERLEALLAS